MKFIDIEQNCDTWFQLRSGKFTSSKAGVVMANQGKAFSEPAKKYAVNIAVEQLTGLAIPSDYQNAHMERGHEQEPLAREMYERESFCIVKNGGFFQDDFIGCSPDGLVGDNGVIEIKSVIATTHYSNIRRRSYDPAYKWQLISNLYHTGSEWLDFVSYCSQFPEDKQLYTHRMMRDDYRIEFEILHERTEQFKKLVEQTKDIILNSDYET